MDKKTVILVPGNFASSLEVDDGPLTSQEAIWINPASLALGGFQKLIYPNPHIRRVNATGLIPGYYDLLRLAMRSAGFDVIDFPYDWRLDVDLIAPILRDVIFGIKSDVYLVAHSLGASLARKALQLLARRESPDMVLANVKGLILLGPANYGTLAGALGLAGAIHQLPLFNVLPAIPSHLQPVLRTFVSLYQVLPWDANRLTSINDPDHDIRTAGFWREMIDLETLFRIIPPVSSGIPWAAMIDTTFFTKRISIILGDAPSTAGGVIFRSNQLTVDTSYNITGDGYVPRVCSFLDDRPLTYIASGVNHIQLPLAESVIHGVVDILEGRIPTTIVRYYQ